MDPRLSVPLLFFCLTMERPVQAGTGCARWGQQVAALNEVTQNIEESPFMVACKEPPGLLKGRPKTALLTRTLTEQDSKGRTSRAFLKKVIAKVRKRIEETRFQMQNIETCMGKVGAPECEELNQWVSKDLPQYVRAARYNLSLAQSENEWSSFLGQADADVNTSMSSLGGFKFEDWAPLTATESNRAQKQLDHYGEEIDAERKKRVAKGEFTDVMSVNFVTESLAAVRYQHYLAYHQMLAELPLLQHLKGPDVSPADLHSGFRTMRTDLDRESSSLDDYEKKLSAAGPLNSDVLGLLNYNSQVEETLLEDNADCGLASSLLYTKGSRQLGNSLAIGLPILAVSILAPPLAGFAVGLAAGTYGAYQSYSAFTSAQQRSLGYIYGDSMGADLANVEQADHRFKYDVVTLPLGMGAAGALLNGAAKVSPSALKLGVRLFKAAAN